MKPKFQPRPSRISAVQNCQSSMPDSATTRAADQEDQAGRDDASPRRSAGSDAPVKKLGANIAMTCHEMPSVASSGEKPQPTMASGAPVMTKLISA